MSVGGDLSTRHQVPWGMGWTVRQCGCSPSWGEEEETPALPSGNSRLGCEMGRLLWIAWKGHVLGWKGASDSQGVVLRQWWGLGSTVNRGLLEQEKFWGQQEAARWREIG